MTTTLHDLTTQKYVLFTTFTNAGERKSTPVWIVEVDSTIGFTTAATSWKLRRLRRNPDCELQPCSSKGTVASGAPCVRGAARQATPDEYVKIRAGVRKKYPFSSRLLGGVEWLQQRRGKAAMGDSAVVINPA